MPAPITSPSSRFTLESHSHAGSYLASLPYMNIQGEWLLNEQGAQLRLEIPYRGYKGVNRSTLWEGKHELWLYDKLVSSTDPIFGGPVWDITANSASGTLSVAAQDVISYFSKKVLKTSKYYTASQGADNIVDLINYGIGSSNIAVTKVTSNGQTSTKTFKANERNKILDLITKISALDDGVEFFSQVVNNVPTIFVYGGKIKPASAIPIVMEYGGTMDGYSVQYNAQGIVNDWDIVSNTNGRIGNAVDTSKQNEYSFVYQDVDNSDQSSSTELNITASTRLADSKSSKTIPTIVTRRLIPFRDFTYGSQFQFIVNDDYVQVNQLVRAIGFQLSIGAGDNTTTVVYSKDTEGVS